MSLEIGMRWCTSHVNTLPETIGDFMTFSFSLIIRSMLNSNRFQHRVLDSFICFLHAHFLIPILPAQEKRFEMGWTAENETILVSPRETGKSLSRSCSRCWSSKLLASHSFGSLCAIWNVLDRSMAAGLVLRLALGGWRNIITGWSGGIKLRNQVVLWVGIVIRSLGENSWNPQKKPKF